VDANKGSSLQSLIDRYSQNWPVHQPVDDYVGTPGEVIILTGSTGALGSQILAQLIIEPSIRRIYAFNRPSKTTSLQRHTEAFIDRGNCVSLLQSGKIIFVDGDTSVDGFNIDVELLEEVSKYQIVH